MGCGMGSFHKEDAKPGTSLARLSTQAFAGAFAVAWAGVAPGNKQSGGKRLRAPTNKGNTHLRAVLVLLVYSQRGVAGLPLCALFLSSPSFPNFRRNPPVTTDNLRN